MNDTNKRWYVAYVADQKRLTALPAAVRSAVLDSAVWIPEKTVYLKIRGKNRELTRPIFPVGYVFVNVDIEAGNVEDAVKAACGGTFLKGAGSSRPTPLTDLEFKNIRQVADNLSSPQSIAQRYELEEDQKVEITKGPFMGMVGKLREIKKKLVVVELSIMGQEVLTDVDPAICFVIKD